MPVFFLILACALWGLSFPVIEALQMEQTGRVPGADSVFASTWIQFARFGMGYANESLTNRLLVGDALIIGANMLMQLVRPPHQPGIAPMP